MSTVVMIVKGRIVQGLEDLPRAPARARMNVQAMKYSAVISIANECSKYAMIVNTIAHNVDSVIAITVFFMRIKFKIRRIIGAKPPFETRIKKTLRPKPQR